MMAKPTRRATRLGVAEGPYSCTNPYNATPTPLHSGLLEEERLAVNHSVVYVFNKHDVCIHRSFLRLATRIHLQPWMKGTSRSVP